MTFGETFAQTSIKGALTRAAVAWVLITPAVAAAKIWWSGTAALVVCLVGVTVYVLLVAQYRRRHKAGGPISQSAPPARR
jgi:hypothetical protein